MQLGELIGRWVGKVEIALAGADEDCRDAEEALAVGDAMRARASARRVLSKIPHSPVGLALLADACDAAHLDAELALTLEELAPRTPSRPEVWLRLARARRATMAPAEDVRDALVWALVAAESGSESRREALLGLADIDLARGDGERAKLWLERTADTTSLDVVVRLAEACLLSGDAPQAKQLLEHVEAPATDGRAALALGRALLALADPAAFGPLLRATVLDVPFASEALSSALAAVPSDAQTRIRVRSVVDAKGEQAMPRWRAAFARSEGAGNTAKTALLEAMHDGDRASTWPLLDMAIDDRDPLVLAAALGALSDSHDARVTEAQWLVRAFPLEEPRAAAALDAVQCVTHPRLLPWARSVADDVAAIWIPPAKEAAWPALLSRLDAHAHAIGNRAVAASLGELAAARGRALHLAVLGEFNAGKSTFINALVGAEVAPTGVLPTTATVHHLRWAPDPFARISFVQGTIPEERIVLPGDLQSTLRTCDGASVLRVEIGLPLAFLARATVLDTPGFNAVDPRHATIARAALLEADVAIWLLDATQAMKQSERTILEEAQRAGLPVQVLVNKADRLAPEDIAQVVEGVRRGLSEIGVASLGAVHVLSARRAVAGRLGDAAALEQSGWPAVKALLDEQILGRGSELKERSLRRRASHLCKELVRAYSERSAAEENDAHERAAQSRAAGLAAVRLEAHAESTATEIARSLRPQKDAWTDDMDLVFVGRDPERARADAVLARYRVDRALALLAEPLASALALFVPEVAIAPSDLLPSARTIVRTAVACDRQGHADVLFAIARSGVATLIEILLLRSKASVSPSRTAGALRELEAFARALG